MAFNANIPTANQLLSTSQSNILDNFTALGTVLDPNAGAHTFPIQGGNPATAATDIKIYSKTSTLAAGQQALVMRQINNGAVREFGISSAAASGWSYVSPGIIMQWGIVVYVAGVNVAVNFPVAFPNAFFSITMTPIAPTNATKSAAQVIGVPTVANFTPFIITTTTGAELSGSLYYIAIGN